MRSDDITKGLGEVGKSWTRQIKSEERRPQAARYRPSMYTTTRCSLKSICWEQMVGAYNQASDHGRLPVYWRQVFYVIRPLCDGHPESDRPLEDKRFKQIFEGYLEEMRPGWDILFGARGVFKEPHSALNDNGLAMSTANVRDYLNTWPPSPEVEKVAHRFPTHGADNRIAAVLICEKEGFDELLEAENVPDRYDVALMSTKGISARAARTLAEDLGAPCFTLHDFDKNGFVMAAGFPFATDLGLRMEDIEKWGLDSEPQTHSNEEKTYDNLIQNGATPDEAAFISEGQRVELNMFTSADFITFVEEKLEEHGVKKVVPDAETLEIAWRRAHQVVRINRVIERTWNGEGDVTGLDDEIPRAPDDLTEQIRKGFAESPELAWDDVVAALVEEGE